MSYSSSISLLSKSNMPSSPTAYSPEILCKSISSFLFLVTLLLFSIISHFSYLNYFNSLFNNFFNFNIPLLLLFICFVKVVSLKPQCDMVNHLNVNYATHVTLHFMWIKTSLLGRKVNRLNKFASICFL